MTRFNTFPEFEIFQFVIIVEEVDVKSTVVAKDFFDTEIAPVIG
jgi:hypothetical protein